MHINGDSHLLPTGAYIDKNHFGKQDRNELLDQEAILFGINVSELGIS